MMTRLLVAIALTLCVLATGGVVQALVAYFVPSVAAAFVDVRVFRTWAGLGIREVAVQSVLLACMFAAMHPPKREPVVSARLVASMITVVAMISLSVWLAVRLPAEIIVYWLVVSIAQILVGYATHRFLFSISDPPAERTALPRKMILLGVSSVAVLCIVVGLAFLYPTPRPNTSFKVELSDDQSATIDAFIPTASRGNRMPAVVIFHGVEGATPLTRLAVHYPNARAISSSGIATFFVRYFDASPYDDLLRMKNGTLDVDAIEQIRLRDYEQWIRIACLSIKEIRKRPEVDPNRIAVIGYSLGCYVGTAATSRLCGEGYPCAMVGNFGAVWPEIQIDPSFPPIQFYHGEQDEIIPVEHVRAAKKRLQECGVRDVELVVYPNQGHVPTGPSSYDIRLSTERFLREQFAPTTHIKP